MSIKQQIPCKTQFLDCLGYYDFGVQLLSIIGIIYITTKCISNYKQLRNERTNQQQSQYQKSIIRKIIVNWINITYLITFFASSLFSIGLFMIYINGGKQNIKKTGLNDWYKFSEVLFINILNCLNLNVGFLYWKASRAFYKFQNKNIPTFLGNKVKVFFYFVFALNGITIFGFFTYILLTYGGDQAYTDLQILWINTANLVGVILSSLMCLSTRIYYDLKILEGLKLNKSVRMTQKIFSFGILSSTLIRVVQGIFDVTIDSQDQFLRSFNNDVDCLDISPIHGGYILFLIIFVDLVPPYLYCQIFSIIKDKKKMNTKSDPYSDLSKKLTDQNSDDSLDYM